MCRRHLNVHSPGYYPTPRILEQNTNLISARCTKISGYSHLIDHSAVCFLCHYSLPDLHQSYKFKYRHIVVQGTRFEGIHCKICNSSITTYNSIINCDFCLNTYFIFANNNSIQNLSLFDYEDPLILNSESDSSDSSYSENSDTSSSSDEFTYTPNNQAILPVNN